MVGFLGLRRASAAAWTPLAPEWCTTGARGARGAAGTAGGEATVASGMEWRDEADEGVAEGAAGFAVAPLGGVLAGAAMVEFERCAGRRG